MTLGKAYMRTSYQAAQFGIGLMLSVAGKVSIIKSGIAMAMPLSIHSQQCTIIKNAHSTTLYILLLTYYYNAHGLYIYRTNPDWGPKNLNGSQDHDYAPLRLVCHP